jgi:hypothetical protein
MATAGDWLVNNEFEVKLEWGRKREDKGGSPSFESCHMVIIPSCFSSLQGGKLVTREGSC